MANPTMAHLDQLEAESIYILREAFAQAKNPVLLYSIGKDSSVLLHLAKKAFYPAKVPMPLLHIDTGWKFREMIVFRDKIVAENDLDLIVHQNSDGVNEGLTPLGKNIDHYTHVMKTLALKQAIASHKFDIAIGGARRDEENARAKERIFSFRNSDQNWDPKRQRPEFWSLFNARVHDGETIRVFPLSNWTERDVWNYIARENIDIVPLYFAQERAVISRNDQLIMIDDDRLKPAKNELPQKKSVRFRTLGCYPLTGAFPSTAKNIKQVIEELYESDLSERGGRLIDGTDESSMERKKREGYF